MSRYIALISLLLWPVACGAPKSTSTSIRTALPAAAASTGVDLSLANNAFAIDAYRTLAADHNGNLALSPASISVALGMTYAGAATQTKDEMAHALRFSDMRDPSEVHQGFRVLLGQLAKLDSDGNELSIANRLFAQQGVAFEQDFTNTVTQNYGASVQLADFRTQSEAARQRINAWVSKQTKGKIPELLAQGVLNKLTRLVLVNAVYLKSQWALPFAPDRTRQEPFQLGGGKTTNVPMMNTSGRFRVAATERASIVEVPYRGQKMSMVLIIPKAIDGLKALEHELNVERVTSWLDALSWHRQVELAVPRFKVASDFMLTSMFEKLGMRVPFTRAADFTRMTRDMKLLISAIVHQAIVEVDEKGTVAAAATGVVISEPVSARAPIPLMIRADRPFLFMIRDHASGALLFMGRVFKPDAASHP